MALEAAYAFDDIGSSTVVDLSGNGRDINLSGQPGAQVSSAGLLDGGALGKTGADTIPLPAALLTASETDDRTFMFDALGLNAVWWLRWESASFNTGVWGALSLDAATIITRARTQANGNPTPASQTIGALSSSVRHNIAMTYVRSTGVVSYYYDGALIGTLAHTPGTALYVGADEVNMAEWATTGPAIDNLRIFSHALTDLEIVTLAGTPVTSNPVDVPGTADASLGALTGTATGTINVTGIMQSSLGGLVGTAIGSRNITGVTSADLGGLAAAVATANVSTTGVALANLDALIATASSIRSVSGTADTSLSALTAVAIGITSGATSGIASLGPLTVTAMGTRSGTGTGIAILGMIAIAIGGRSVSGTALANLGQLIAIAIIPNPVPTTRLRVSGREPYHYASGRESQESV